MYVLDELHMHPMLEKPNNSWSLTTKKWWSNSLKFTHKRFGEDDEYNDLCTWTRSLVDTSLLELY